MSRIVRRQNKPSGLTLRHGPFWEVLPGERLRFHLASLRGPNYWSKKWAGGTLESPDRPESVVICDDQHVYFEVNPELRCEIGKAPFWRLQPGQLFIFEDLEVNRTWRWAIMERLDRDRARSWRTAISDIDQAARCRFNNNMPVLVLPQHARLPSDPQCPDLDPSTFDLCQSCANIGWVISDCYGSRQIPEGAIALLRCDECMLYESDAQAAVAAKQCGLTLPDEWPYLLEGPDEIIEDYAITLRVRTPADAILRATQSVVEDVIDGALRNVCNVDRLSVRLVMPQPPPLPSLPRVPQPRTRVIDLNSQK
jgi:hypothetical protein